MNLPNKLTITRLILSVIIVIILCVPFYSFGIDFLKDGPEIGGITLRWDYIIAGVLFIIASLTDFFDGYIARKRGLVTNTGKMLDAIADKVLVNSVLIILASKNEINAIIPVIIVVRDIVVNAIKMQAAKNGKVQAAIKSGKYKTAFMMIGLSLTFFYNIPFEFMNIRVDLGFLFLACILSIVSAYEYYKINKDLIYKNS